MKRTDTDGGGSAPKDTAAVTDRIRQWLDSHTFHHSQFSNLAQLVEQKKKMGVTISLCIPTLNEEKTIGKEIVLFKSELMTRFENPALRHRTRQIAMDASQKLPQRLLAGAADRLAAGQDITALALGVAAWMRWQSGVTESGEAFAVDDPLTDQTAALLAGAATDADRVAALLTLRAVFPEALATDDRFVQAVTGAYLSLSEHGAIEAARRVVNGQA